jgi:hypothetical protein
MGCVLPWFAAVVENDDPANEARNSAALSALEELAGKHGDQDANSNRPRISWEYRAERGATHRPYYSSDKAAQPKLSTFGWDKIGSDNRRNECINGML